MTTTRRAHLSLAVRAASAALCMLGLLGLVGSSVRASDSGTVVVLPTSGVVDQVMARYVSDGIAAAAADGAPAVVIKLDTPGGSLDAMRTIFQAELNAPIPVIVWVGPSGARAASAGTFIALASHILSMAPGTNIGAASPVDQNGGDITGTEGQKVMNDAIATITSIATQRNRPVAWAVTTVKDAQSYSVDQAITAGAVNFQANSVDDVLAQADGLTVDVQGTSTVVHTAGAPWAEVQMNPFQSFLHLLADPNIAFILFTVGFYGLLFEVAHPNFVTGILGGLALILAFIGFGSLPLNVAGLLLIGLACILFVLELTITSHGLLTIGGLVAFVLGAAALYTTPGTPAAPDVSVAWPLIVVMTLLTGLVVLGIVRVALRTRRMRPVNVGIFGKSSTPVQRDTLGTVHRALAPEGTVYAAGEEWSARTASGQVIPRGTAVRVLAQEGLTLIVEPAQEAVPTAAAPA